MKNYFRCKSEDRPAGHLPDRPRRRRRLQRLRPQRVWRRPERTILARLPRLDRELALQGQRGPLPGRAEDPAVGRAAAAAHHRPRDFRQGHQNDRQAKV